LSNGGAEMSDKCSFRCGINSVVSIKEVCTGCDGYGYILNPDFEACRIPGHPSHNVDCDGTNECPDVSGCMQGEIIPCPVCEGKGK